MGLYKPIVVDSLEIPPPVDTPEPVAKQPKKKRKAGCKQKVRFEEKIEAPDIARHRLFAQMFPGRQIE
jgi:hypothetical protein